MITELENYMRWLENNVRFISTFSGNSKVWQIPDKLNNGEWKVVDRAVVIMDYLKTKIKGSL